MLRLRSSEKVEDLRAYLTTQLGHSNFKILNLAQSGWVPIENETQTLAETGLGPRATLQLAQNEEKKFDEMQKHIGMHAKYFFYISNMFYFNSL